MTDSARGAYRIHTAREGFSSILHAASGEIMHSRMEPMAEARRLYVEQARLAERLRAGSAPLILWDVGLGAAANALAAVETHSALTPAGPRRDLEIFSFENDLDSLHLAAAHRDRFPYLDHPAVTPLLADGRWDGPGIRWRVIPGDFCQTLTEAPAPEVIFYDMYSAKTSGPLWTLAHFQNLFAACAGRPAELFTYTVSTAARSALLAAGFWVARGRSAGAKEETTIALTPAARATPPGDSRTLLGPEWLTKWERSAARWPDWLSENSRDTFARAIEAHPQFAVTGQSA